MKKILVTTDLSEESKQAFPKAIELANAFAASIDLLVVIEDPAQAAFSYAIDFPVCPLPDIQKQVLKKVEASVNELGAKYFTGIPCQCALAEASGPVHQEIIRYAKANNIDLIIMATHGRTGFRHLLIGSVAERVMRESHCPVLIVPSKKR